MTPEQRELARHALGLTDGRKVSYRNYFMIEEGGAGYGQWQELVGLGLAIRFERDSFIGRDYCFVLTERGALAALDEGESLDPEDFPNATPEGVAP